MNYVYIDLDSGTVLSGPIYAVSADALTGDETDDDVRAIAKSSDGTEVKIAPLQKLRDKVRAFGF